MPVIRVEVCASCKGYKLLCGLPRCPILERARFVREVELRVGGEVYGATPPSTLVGEHGYPHVRVMFNVPPGETGDPARIHDDPPSWWGRAGLEDIIRFRATMLYSTVRADARRPADLYSREIPLAAVSQRPTEAEVSVARRPNARVTFSLRELPIGPTAPASRVRIVGNPRVPRALERLIWDDVPAGEAVGELYARGVDVYVIQRALAMGLLGAPRRRRLVPTRWAITAVDVMVGDMLMRRVRRMPWLDHVMAGSLTYLANEFFVMLVPGPWRALWVELWSPAVFSAAGNYITIVNREDVRGRRRSMDGGYEAARLAVLEGLAGLGRQATAIIVRRIRPEYYVGVGNWHVRETVRRLMGNLRRYQSVDEALQSHELGSVAGRYLREYGGTPLDAFL